MSDLTPIKRSTRPATRSRLWLEQVLEGPGRVKGPLPFTSVPHLPLSSYVKSYLLPDKQSKRKTTVKKRNLNPVFNEILRVRLRRRGGPH